MTDPTEKKVERFERYDMTHVADVIACLAANLEDAYCMAGVTDYTARDCVDLVAREVIREWVRDFKIVGGAQIHIKT